MTTVRAITGAELITLRKSGQFTRLYLAGTETPPVVFAARVNQIATSNDKISEFIYDGVTTGAYTDILAGQTLWLGSAAGLYDLGIARVRKAATATVIYIGEGSDIDWVNADDMYVTVIDEMGLWAKHASGAFVDKDIAYTDQNTVFSPRVLMGANVVKDVTDYPVLVTFPEAANSTVIDSTISTWAWTATAGTFDNAAISAPTLTIASYPANGLIRVSLTLTSAAGKSHTGYRYVRVYDSTHLPITQFNMDNCDSPVEEGGWSFGVTLYGEAARTTIRDRAPMVLFARDYYDGELVSLGLDEGRENIVCSGWVDGETIDYNPTAGSVSFEVKGAAAWLAMLPAYPLTLEIPRRAPTLWTQMPALTLDRAAYFICHWRSTIDTIMDVKYTGDTRLAAKMEAAQSPLLEQLRSISRRIFATPFVDQYGNMSINIAPQYVPEADRAWAVLQTITDADWIGGISINRRDVSQAAMVTLIGRKASASTNSVSYYSLSNGHIYKRFGAIEAIDDVLVSGQAQANELAGLHAGYKNMEYTFGIKLAANNRMITMMPNQFLYIEVAAADNVRGIEYAGNIIPRSVSLVWDADNSILLTEINCDAETFAELAINGDIPNDTSGVDNSTPPEDAETEMPALAEILPPGTVNQNHPKNVVLVSSNFGVLFTNNFDDDDPEYQTMNNGLSEAEYQSIGQIVRTSDGGLYIMCDGDTTDGYNKIYYASRLGAAWQLVATSDLTDENIGIFSALGNNPQSSTQVAVLGGLSNVIGQWNGSFFLASTSGLGSRTQDLFMRGHYRSAAILTQSGWYLFTQRADGFQGTLSRGSLWKLTTGGSMEDSGISGNQGAYNLTFNFLGQYFAAGCGSLDKVFYWNTFNTGYGLFETPANQSTSTDVNPKSVQAFAPSPTGQVIMCGSGVTGVPYRSLDGGAVWENMAGVIAPVSGLTVWENCGDNGRWIFGGGTNLKLTTDVGATGFNKEGNLTYFAPLINITQIRFIS